MLNYPNAALALVFAGAAIAGAGRAGVGTASAAPARPSADAPIVLAANGCGPGFFRTIAGSCVPNLRMRGPRGRVFAPPPCPRGYLRDPNPARPLCYPVY